MTNNIFAILLSWRFLYLGQDFCLNIAAEKLEPTTNILATGIHGVITVCMG